MAQRGHTTHRHSRVFKPIGKGCGSFSACSCEWQQALRQRGSAAGLGPRYLLAELVYAALCLPSKALHQGLTVVRQLGICPHLRSKGRVSRQCKATRAAPRASCGCSYAASPAHGGEAWCCMFVRLFQVLQQLLGGRHSAGRRQKNSVQSRYDTKRIDGCAGLSLLTRWASAAQDRCVCISLKPMSLTVLLSSWGLQSPALSVMAFATASSRRRSSGDSSCMVA